MSRTRRGCGLILDSLRQPRAVEADLRDEEIPLIQGTGHSVPHPWPRSLLTALGEYPVNLLGIPQNGVVTQADCPVEIQQQEPLPGCGFLTHLIVLPTEPSRSQASTTRAAMCSSALAPHTRGS